MPRSQPLHTPAEERDYINRLEADIGRWRLWEEEAAKKLKVSHRAFDANPADATLEAQYLRDLLHCTNYTQARLDLEHVMVAAKRAFGWSE